VKIIVVLLALVGTIGCASTPVHDERACADGVSTWRVNAGENETRFSKCFSGAWSESEECDGDRIVTVDWYLIDRSRLIDPTCSITRPRQVLFGEGYQTRLFCGPIPIADPGYPWIETARFIRHGQTMTIINHAGDREELLRCEETG
jgi:hypothetical protein